MDNYIFSELWERKGQKTDAVKNSISLGSIKRNNCQFRQTAPNYAFTSKFFRPKLTIFDKFSYVKSMLMAA